MGEVHYMGFFILNSLDFNYGSDLCCVALDKFLNLSESLTCKTDLIIPTLWN